MSDEKELARLKKEAAEKAKTAAAEKAKAAVTTQAKMKTNTKQESEPAPETPSPNELLLQQIRMTIEKQLGSEKIEDYYINKLSKDVPTIVAKPNSYFAIAHVLRKQLGFGSLSELHGTDFETHMEVYVHLYSFEKNHSVVLKVKLDREEPKIDSLVPLWKGANWPECEAYDLLGIYFTNHPQLKRILLGENWVGYPLRKDYQPYDVEV